jgi:hypothetical protein
MLMSYLRGEPAMKRAGFCALMLGSLMLSASHASALVQPGAIVPVVCPGGYAYNGQTGLLTNVVLRNTGGTIKIIDVRIYNEGGTLLKSYSASNPPPGFSMNVPELKMTALSGQAVFGPATIGRLTILIRYQNVTSPSAAITEALVTATEFDFDQGRLASRSTVVCR